MDLTPLVQQVQPELWAWDQLHLEHLALKVLGERREIREILAPLDLRDLGELRVQLAHKGPRGRYHQCHQLRAVSLGLRVPQALLVALVDLDPLDLLALLDLLEALDLMAALVALDPLDPTDLMCIVHTLIKWKLYSKRITYGFVVE